MTPGPFSLVLAILLRQRADEGFEVRDGGSE